MTRCLSCDEPMAVDQRYCLNCGARGGEARLPFLDVLRTAAPPVDVVPYGQGPAQRPWLAAATPVGGAVPPTAQERLQANTGLIAGVGVLLLALLIGVVIGSQFGGDQAQVAAAPQAPIVVGAPAAVAATGPTGVTGTATTAAAADSPATSSASKRKSASKSSSAASKAAKAPVKATNAGVKNLDKLTGKAAQKAADKLGKTIATGGKAPKKDSKPAAAGGSFQDIG